MSFVRGVGFEPTTSLPGTSIEAFPRSDATTAPFPSPWLIIIRRSGACGASGRSTVAEAERPAKAS
jgi:hypothetical protein